MAKVMISLPDDLLHRLDQGAKERSMTRSGLLRELAERELSKRDGGRAALIEELLDSPVERDGKSAEWIRADRCRNDS